MSTGRLRQAKRVMTWVLGPVFIGYMAWYLLEHRAAFARALSVDAATLAWMSLLVVVTLLVRPLQMHIMLRLVGMSMPLRRSLVLIFASNVLNYLPLRPGTLMQATLLKRDASLKYASFLAVLTAQMLVLVAGGGLLAAAATAWRLIGGERGGHAWTLLGLMLAAGLAPIALLHLPATLAARRRWWIERALHDMLCGWRALRAQRSAFAAIMALTAVKLLSTAGRLWLAFAAFGVPAGAVACITLAAVVQATFLVSFTPGGLGLRQLLVSLAASGLGMQFGEGMFASTLDHGVAILVTVAVGLPCALSLLYGPDRQAPSPEPPAQEDAP